MSQDEENAMGLSGDEMVRSVELGKKKKGPPSNKTIKA